MDVSSALLIAYHLVLILPFVRTQSRLRIGMTIIVPSDDSRTKAMIRPGSIDAAKSIRTSMSNLRRYNIMPSKREKYLKSGRSAGGTTDVLDMYCNEIFGDSNNVALMTLALNNRDKRMVRKLEYVESIAEEFGLPLISWNPDYSGSMESEKDRLILQMAPTIYHQAQAILQLLREYNWTHFTIVTTSEDSYFEFNAAIDALMKDHEANRKITEKFTYTKLQVMVIPILSPDDGVPEMIQFFRKANLEENRIYILHSVRYSSDIIEAAKECEMTTPKHLWILTSESVSIISKQTRFPVGFLGITHQYTGKLETAIKKAFGNAGKVWATAVEKFARDVSFTNSLPGFACDNTSSTRPWPHGKTFFEHMKSVSIIDGSYTIGFHSNGLSKYVELQIINVQMDRSTGRRSWKQIGRWIPVRRGRSVELKLFLDGVMWPGMSPIPPKGRPDKRHFRIATLQEEPYVMYRSPNNITGACTRPAVKCHIVYNSTVHGNDTSHENGTVESCCTGLSIDILTIMSQEMEFDFYLYEVPDRVCGVRDEISHEWNGLIRELQMGKADMVITSLQITPNRANAVDFSMPYLETGTSIIVSIRKDKVSATAVLEPYDYPAWCLILVFSVHSIGASIFIFEWLSPRGLDQGKTPMREHTFSLFRSFWLIWAMLFQSSVSADNPRGVSSRFLGNVWALFALVFLASYTANLAAFMITKDTYYDLSGLKDWRLTKPKQHKPPFKFGTIPNGSTEETLRQYHPSMFTYMTRFNKPNVSEAIKALKKGDIQAFIYDSSPLQYQVGIDKDCTLMAVGKPNAMSGYGVAFPKGSSKLVEEVNRIILDLEDNGELGRLRKFWLSGPCHTKNRISQSSDKLGILNFTSAFILLATGIVLGGILLILEHTYFRFGRKCLKKYDKWGCCALVSLSMGKSLTFEQSVMDAVGFCKRHKCKDPLCETQMWKVKHELDLALLKIEKLNSEIRKNKMRAIKAGAKDDAGEDGNYMPVKQRVHLPDEQGQELYANIKSREAESDKPRRELNSHQQEVEADINNQTHSVDVPDRNNMRRSPSYNAAVEPSTENGNTSDRTAKTRYNDGKYYVNVDTGEDNGEV